MIVVDTSALIAIARKESQAMDCFSVLARTDLILISAPTLTEAFVVAGQKNVTAQLVDLLETIRLQVIPLDEAGARLAADAYSLWGKNYHPAEINYGDSFSYSLAKQMNCPLLFIGNDFSQTDIASAI